MSNWHMCNFIVNELKFNCSEQYFMYLKAIHFNDMETARKILAVKHPREQKDLGRQVKNYSEYEWNAIRYVMMVEATYQKFSQDEYSKNKLLETGNKMLVEASPYDCVWGVGLDENNDKILDENNWRGLNLLGEALGEVRDRLNIKEIKNYIKELENILVWKK